VTTVAEKLVAENLETYKLMFWTLSYHVKLLASVDSGTPYPLLHQQTHLYVLEMPKDEEQLMTQELQKL